MCRKHLRPSTLSGRTPILLTHPVEASHTRHFQFITPHFYAAEMPCLCVTLDQCTKHAINHTVMDWKSSLILSSLFSAFGSIVFCLETNTHSHPAALVASAWDNWSEIAPQVRHISLMPLSSIWWTIRTQIRGQYIDIDKQEWRYWFSCSSSLLCAGAKRRLLACLTMMSPQFRFIGWGLGGDCCICVCFHVSVKSPRGVLLKWAQLVPLTPYQWEWNRKWSHDPFGGDLPNLNEVGSFCHGEIQTSSWFSFLGCHRVNVIKRRNEVKGQVFTPDLSG